MFVDAVDLFGNLPLVVLQFGLKAQDSLDGAPFEEVAKSLLVPWNVISYQAIVEVNEGGDSFNIGINFPRFLGVAIPEIGHFLDDLTFHGRQILFLTGDTPSLPVDRMDQFLLLLNQVVVIPIHIDFLALQALLQQRRRRLHGQLQLFEGQIVLFHIVGQSLRIGSDTGQGSPQQFQQFIHLIGGTDQFIPDRTTLLGSPFIFPTKLPDFCFQRTNALLNGPEFAGLPFQGFAFALQLLQALYALCKIHVGEFLESQQIQQQLPLLIHLFAELLQLLLFRLYFSQFDLAFFVFFLQCGDLGFVGPAQDVATAVPYIVPIVFGMANTAAFDLSRFGECARLPVKFLQGIAAYVVIAQVQLGLQPIV